MKKVELHVHLDGSIRPETVSELLNMEIDEVKKQMIVNDNNRDLKDYLTKFKLSNIVMQSKENLIRVSKEMVEDLKKDGVIYAEVRFAPVFHTKEGLSFDDIISSVLEGINQVDGIKINLLLCMMRGIDYELNLETIKCAKRFLNKGVVGIDLAGDENRYKTKDYEDLFEIAKKEKIPFTIHAGEADGVESLNSAISFGTTRLGHGIRSLESENTINLIKNNNITLEICPTSNIQTRVIDKYENYPIRKLIDKGILVTINTDNRTVSNVTLNKEYELLRKYFNFTNEDFLQMNINAINASFISKKEKIKFIDILKENYKENNI